MAENTDNRSELIETVNMFEQMLEEDRFSFFTEQTFEKLIEHYHYQNLNDKALKVCEVALEQHPFSLEIILQKANILSLNGNYSDAFRAISKAETLYPYDTELLLLKGNMHAMAGNYKEAIDSFETVLPNAQEKDEVLYSIGFAYQTMGKVELASKYYMEALEVSK